jgi:predicted amidophosphoribosyltransferase
LSRQKQAEYFGYSICSGNLNRNLKGNHNRNLKMLRTISTNIFEYAHLVMRVCPICGSFRTQHFLACHYCTEKLKLDAAKSQPIQLYDCILVLPLWSWVRDSSKRQSILISALKYHSIAKDWDVLAEMITDLAEGKLLSVRSRILFISCPGRSPKKDHAWYLAEALTRRCGGRHWEILKRTDDLNMQKSKTRVERSMIGFSLNENFSKNLMNKERIVFVDDVVTTGSTAFAAFEALGCPKNFEVWCIAYRQLAAS